MRLLHKALVVTALGSFALGGSLLRAEPGDDDDNVEETAPIEKDANLTPAEMSAKSEVYLKDMQAVLVRVVELRQLARKQKDVIKLNCVNDKLLQLKQLLNIAEAGRTDLVEAVAQADSQETLHQYSQISIAKEKTEALRNEAEGCIGEELVFLGPTEVTTDNPPFPDDPTGEDAFDWDDIIEPPGYASPFL